MTTLPLFWHLSSTTTKDRIDASVKLVSALEQFQAKFSPKDPPTPAGSDAEQDEAPAQDMNLLDALNAHDVSYSIRRLVRGLASPRDSSRLGFAVALTELLSRINTVTCLQISNLIMDGTKIQGSMSGQEERDVLFARLFGFASVIQSGLLVRTGALPTSPSSAPQISSLSCFEQVIKQLLVLGEKKSWLRESSWWTISLALNVLHDSTVPWKSEAINSSLQHLFVDYQTWHPEKVALAFQLQDEYPSFTWAQYLCPLFKNPVLLHPDNLQAVARILKESGTYDEDKDVVKAAAGAWKPDLHYVWDIVLNHYLPKSDSQISDDSFQEFYRIAVDESLFAPTSSTERKYWGFQVFKKALLRVTQSTMHMLFTKNFMRCWINHLSSKDRYLHKIARQVALDIQSFVQQNPQLGFPFILQLTGLHGHQQFDKLTKTKTVESIITSLDKSGIEAYVKYLFSQFNESEGNERSNASTIASRREWIIDQLGALVRNSSVPKSDEWITSVLNWLIVHGLFVIKNKSTKSLFPLHSLPQPPLSEELCQSITNRLLTGLGDLSAHVTVTQTGEKSLKTIGAASDGEPWMSKVLKAIGELEADSKHVELRIQPTSEVRKLQKKGRKLLSSLREAKSNETSQGAELLLGVTLLQSYCGVNKGMEELEASLDGVSRLFPYKKGHKNSAELHDESEKVPDAMDVLVDLIIGFMEKSAAYLRVIGNQAFALLSGSVKESTIRLILTQLERRDPSQLLEEGDEDESDDDGTAVDEDNTGSEGESEESASDPDENDDEEPDEGLRDEVGAILHSTSIPIEDGSESDEMMDDDQMMALDEQLANVFRNRVDVKKKSISAQREATHFKNRVLDLVDTFAKTQTTSSLNILLINPLIEVLITCSSDERQLADKTRGILRARFGRSKDVPLNVDLDSVKSVLDAVHTQAGKARTSETLGSLGQCSIYLARTMLHYDAKDALLAVYRRSLTDFLTRKKSTLHTAFFQDFLQRFPPAAWCLADDFLDLSTKAVNTYRQCQAFHLVEVLLNSLPPEINITAFIPKLSQALLQTIQGACDDEISLSAAQVKGLLKLALVAIRQAGRHGATEADAWDSSTWINARAKIQGSSRYKSSTGLVKMCDQIVRALQGSGAAATADRTKRKAPNSAEEGALSSVKRKRRKE